MTSALESLERFAARVLPADTAEPARACFSKLALKVNLIRDRSFDTERNQDSLVFVAEGATKLVAHASAEREQVIAFYFTDDILVLPGSGEHSFSLHALRDSDLLVFPYPEFLELAAGSTGVLRQLLDRSSLSLQRCRDKVIALGRKSAMERLVSFLLAMGERIGVAEGGQIALALPMSRRDIADSLGLTIETVSRQLTLLREAGLIETMGRSKIILLALPKLEARAGYLREVA